jgi:hypothetical protein
MSADIIGAFLFSRCLRPFEKLRLLSLQIHSYNFYTPFPRHIINKKIIKLTKIFFLLLTTKARVQSHSIPFGICGEWSDPRAKSFRILRFPLPILVSPTVPFYILSSGVGTMAYLRTEYRCTQPHFTLTIWERQNGPGFQHEDPGSFPGPEIVYGQKSLEKKYLLIYKGGR